MENESVATQAESSVNTTENASMSDHAGPATITKLYVGSLPYSYTAEQLEELFGSFGRITSAAIVSDQVTRRSKGFGFVEFESAEAARKAMEKLNGQEIEGRMLSVREARPHVDRSGSGSGDRSMSHNNNNDRGGYRDRTPQSVDNTDFTDISGRTYGNRRGWW